MNATKKAGKARAINDIAGAIEDTRRRLIGGSAKDLQAKAQAAFSEQGYAGIPEQHRQRVQVFIAAEVLRGRRIPTPEEAYRDIHFGWKKENAVLAVREASAVRDAAAILKRAGVSVKEYGWGAIFSGSKPALVKAGLVAKQKPKGVKEYFLPLNWEDGYNAACYGSIFHPDAKHGPIPPRWNARFFKDRDGFRVWVTHHRDHVSAVTMRESAAEILAELDSPAPNLDFVRLLVRKSAPPCVGVAVPLWIMAAQNFPKGE